MATNSKKRNQTNLLIEQFCTITGESEEYALLMLQKHDDNLETAINVHMESLENTPIEASLIDCESVLDQRDDEEVVRPPIPPQAATLLEHGNDHFYPQRWSHSVFDHFRDFQVEARRQEEMLLEPNTKTSRVRLEDLFRPPLDLVFHGAFQNAKDAGVKKNKWLMVNVQNTTEFACQVLNRDVWSDQAIRTIILEHFIFWQIYTDSTEGQRFMTFYKIDKWPYVSILDPRTGELVKVWNDIKTSSFCNELLAFLMDDYRYDFNTCVIKRPRIGDVPTSDLFFGTNPSFPTASISGNESLVGSSTNNYTNMAASSSSRSSTITSAVNKMVLKSSIIDLDEEEQLRVAIEASREGMCEGNSSSSTISSKSVDKIESIKDDESDYEISSESEEGEQDSVKGGSTEAMNTLNADKVEGKREEFDSKCDEFSKDRKRSDGENCMEGTLEAKKLWTDYLGRPSDPKYKLILRYPNGQREEVEIPCTSKLEALVLLVASKGYNTEEFELVTNFPKRVLSTAMNDMSLEIVGLHSQETVFVQKR